MCQWECQRVVEVLEHVGRERRDEVHSEGTLPAASVLVLLA